MENEKKKKFIAPLVEIIDFTNDDIVTASGHSDWGDDDNGEPFVPNA